MSRCVPPPPRLLTIAILAMVPALSAYAGPQVVQPVPRDLRQHDGHQDGGQSRDNSSLSDAVRRIERHTRGEVLSAERVQFDGRDMHRVKVVDDQGRVRVFMQDPTLRHDNGADTDGTDATRNDEGGDGTSGHGSQRHPRPTHGNDD